MLLSHIRAGPEASGKEVGGSALCLQSRVTGLIQTLQFKNCRTQFRKHTSTQIFFLTDLLSRAEVEAWSGPSATNWTLLVYSILRVQDKTLRKIVLVVYTRRIKYEWHFAKAAQNVKQLLTFPFLGIAVLCTPSWWILSKTNWITAQGVSNDIKCHPISSSWK